MVVEAAGKTTAGMAAEAAGKEAGMHKAAAGKRGRTTATSDDASAVGAPPPPKRQNPYCIGGLGGLLLEQLAQVPYWLLNRPKFRD